PIAAVQPSDVVPEPGSCNGNNAGEIRKQFQEGVQLREARGSIGRPGIRLERLARGRGARTGTDIPLRLSRGAARGEGGSGSRQSQAGLDLPALSLFSRHTIAAWSPLR